MLLDAAFVNFAQKEHCIGFSYMVVSRIRMVPGVVVEKPFDFEHFRHKKSEISRDREADFILRSGQLL